MASAGLGMARPKERTEGGAVGAGGGALAGAGTGALIGTAVAPGVGTAVGALIGAGVGAGIGLGAGSAMGMGAKRKRHAQEQAEQEWRAELERRAGMVQRVKTIYGEGSSQEAQTNRALIGAGIDQQVTAGRQAALDENIGATGSALSGMNALAARTGNVNTLDKTGVIANYGANRAKVAQAARGNRSSAWAALAAKRRALEGEVNQGASLNPQFDAMQAASEMQSEQGMIWPNLAWGVANQGMKVFNMAQQADAAGYDNPLSSGGRPASNKAGVTGARVA